MTRGRYGRAVDYVSSPLALGFAFALHSAMLLVISTGQSNVRDLELQARWTTPLKYEDVIMVQMCKNSGYAPIPHRTTQEKREPEDSTLRRWLDSGRTTCASSSP